MKTPAIDESLVFLIGNALAESNRKYFYVKPNQKPDPKKLPSDSAFSNFQLNEAFIDLALLWKSRGNIGESLSCLRSSMHRPLIDHDFYGQKVKLQSLNSLGLLTRTIYFYDTSDGYSLTKSLVNMTLVEMYNAYSQRNFYYDQKMKDLDFGRSSSKEHTLLMSLYEKYELGKRSHENSNHYLPYASGMCLTLFTFFDLISNGHFTVVKFDKEVDWQVNLQNNKLFIEDEVGYSFLKWSKGIWDDTCVEYSRVLHFNPKLFGEYERQSVLTMIDDILLDDRTDFLSFLIEQYFGDNYTSGQVKYTMIIIVGMVLIMVLILPTDEDEENRKKLKHKALNKRSNVNANASPTKQAAKELEKEQERKKEEIQNKVKQMEPHFASKHYSDKIETIKNIIRGENYPQRKFFGVIFDRAYRHARFQHNESKEQRNRNQKPTFQIQDNSYGDGFENGFQGSYKNAL